MVKKILVGTVFLLLVFQGAVFAAESEGEIVFRDALYGAVVGVILGGAVYLVDDDDFSAKIGMGMALGTLGGLVFGIMETRSFVEIKDSEIKVALPSPVIYKRDNGILYSASLLRVNF